MPNAMQHSTLHAHGHAHDPAPGQPEPAE